MITNEQHFYHEGCSNGAYSPHIPTLKLACLSVRCASWLTSVRRVITDNLFRESNPSDSRWLLDEISVGAHEPSARLTRTVRGVVSRRVAQSL
jgi:hypothetical protein